MLSRADASTERGDYSVESAKTRINKSSAVATVRQLPDRRVVDARDAFTARHLLSQ